MGFICASTALYFEAKGLGGSGRGCAFLTWNSIIFEAQGIAKTGSTTLLVYQSSFNHSLDIPVTPTDAPTPSSIHTPEKSWNQVHLIF